MEERDPGEIRSDLLMLESADREEMSTRASGARM